jgi:4-amino-4-deoxy-L-arabinose transferase-like glycosyltransferase
VKRALGPFDSTGSLVPRDPASLRAIGSTILLAAILLAFGLGSFPLLEPDEGRYADIAREVLSTGDCVVPRLDGIPFHDKPPLVPWLVAVSFAGFGASEWAARAVPALAGLAGIGLAAWLAATIAGRRAALLAALALASSPLWMGFSRFLVLDVPFATLLAGGFALLLRGAGALDAPPSARVSAAGGVLIGLATLTKGPVALVLAGLAALALVLVERDRSLAWRLLGPVPWTSAVAVSAPWFVAFGLRDPEGLRAFLVHENLERFRDAHEHQHAWHFYFVTALWGFSPAALLLVLASGRAPWARAERGLALLALAVLVFFQLASSKVETYILPAFPALAALAGIRLDRALATPVSSARLGATALVVSAAAVLAPAAWLVFARVESGSRDLHWAWLAESARTSSALALLALPPALASVVAWWRGRATSATALALAAASALLASALPALATVARWKSALPIARAISTHRRPGERVLAFATYLRGLAFYLGEPVPLALTTSELDRGEVQRARPDLVLEDDATLVASLATRPLLVVVPGDGRERTFLERAERAGANVANGKLVLLERAGDELLYELR